MKDSVAQKIISYLYIVLFLLVPIIFYPKSFEVFEFNKLILIYVATILIAAFWALRSIIQRKIILRRTILDIPLIIFLASQIISSIISIDQRSSLFGYYSRFNGGLFSVISYSVLYWAYVSNVTKKDILRHTNAIIMSAAFVSIYGILEHFGKSPSCIFITGKFDAACWVQDVTSRPFATLGQPNWLAAFLVASMPLVWVNALRIDFRKPKFYGWIAVSIILFVALLFTKSRSGVLGFAGAFGIFALEIIIFSKKYISKIILIFGISLFLALIIGTPWNIKLPQATENPKNETANTQTAIEAGGTESGEIRKIVWKGAFDLWRAYPVFGTGVETFANSYYLKRPIEHNLTSEWNFIYNKAHNEYLNYLATTGTIGFLAYSFLIFAMLYVLSIKFFKRLRAGTYYLAFLPGFVSILITNFFGFSVTSISLLFFLIPAITIVSSSGVKPSKDLKLSDSSQKTFAVLTILLAVFGLALVARYWRADYLYAEGIRASKANEYKSAISSLDAAIKLSPAEALYHNELATVYSDIASALSDQNDDSKKDLLASIVKESERESDIAVSLSPNSVKITKARSNIFTTLAYINTDYYTTVLSSADKLTTLAPNDPSVYYLLGLTYTKIGDYSKANGYLDKSIELKNNYRNPRFLKAYIDKESDPTEALSQLNYILEHISPNDKEVITLKNDIIAP